jgi:hypothetical protein
VPAGAGETHAMNNGFTYLGERYVRGNGREVRESIAGLRNDGRWRKVMIVVENAPVEMNEVVITFASGQKYEPHTSYTFGPGETSRIIDLPGDLRTIRRVDFFMHNLPGNGQAKVELWAR